MSLPKCESKWSIRADEATPPGSAREGSACTPLSMPVEIALTLTAEGAIDSLCFGAVMDGRALATWDGGTLGAPCSRVVKRTSGALDGACSRAAGTTKTCASTTLELLQPISTQIMEIERAQSLSDR
jgi:hypothetical protein